MKVALESRARSLVKAATWRCLATCVTIAILYVLTGKVEFSIGTGVLINFVKTILYYLHERIWTRITWGINRRY